MKLIYHPDRIPRTTTRAEWREMHRRLRLLERSCRQMMADNRKALEDAISNAILYGTAANVIREDLTMRAVNPPVMFYP